MILPTAIGSAEVLDFKETDVAAFFKRKNSEVHVLRGNHVQYLTIGATFPVRELDQSCSVHTPSHANAITTSDYMHHGFLVSMPKHCLHDCQNKAANLDE